MRRVGIIGIGTIAQVHIESLIKCGCEIVALCDCEIKKCRAAAEKFGLNARVYEDYLRMLDCEKPDAVHICTPHALHAPMAKECLARNINVLCEKPLAVSEEQLMQLEEAVKSSRAQLGVCHQRRYEPITRYLKKICEEEKALSAYGVCFWKRDKAYYESAPWRGKRALSGGGSLINQALHTLDLLQWFCGMPETVTGNVFNHTLGGVIDVEDGTFGVYSYADGRRFVLASTNACNDCFPVNIALRTEKKSLQMTDEYLIEDGKMLETRDDFPVPAKKEWGNGHLRLISDFYRCLGQKEKFPIDFYEGSKVVRLILALYASDGKPIALAGEKKE